MRITEDEQQKLREEKITKKELIYPKFKPEFLKKENPRMYNLRKRVPVQVCLSKKVA
ncbi:unnamed protein product [Moneuplotes crassus]|uniref:Uncharacterized protein n=1 Tax=Euplotes crassus TaxID=5936 RepID=A0AAD1XW20_EUPCR|nr:unnamed protein product [Moneuplotes crassus]